MANTQKISRKNLHKFYVKVCTGWQTNITKLLVEQQVEDEISVPNSLIEQAYNEADADVKKMLKEHFNLDVFQSIKDKVKTWDDVLKVSGKTEDEIFPYKNPSSLLQKKLNAIAKVSLIADVLNQDWKADFTKSDYKYYPYFERKISGWVFCDYISDSYISFCSSGVAYFKSSNLANYAGKTFTKEYQDIFENY